MNFSNSNQKFGLGSYDSYQNVRVPVGDLIVELTLAKLIKNTPENYTLRPNAEEMLSDGIKEFFNRKQLRNIFSEFYERTNGKKKNQDEFLEDFITNLLENQTYYKPLNAWLSKNLGDVTKIVKVSHVPYDAAICFLGIYAKECAKKLDLISQKDEILLPSDSIKN